MQVKIWFQNHRYKTKKSLKDQNHADHRAAAAASDAVPTSVERALSPRKVAAPGPVIKDEKKSSTEDDSKRRRSVVDVVPSDQQDVSLPLPGLVLRSSPADLRPGNALGHPTSMYVGETMQSRTPPMFLQTPTSADTGSVPAEFQLAVDEYRARLQQAVAARPCGRSPADSTPSPFTADPGLASVLYAHRDTSAAACGPMGYYYPAYTPATNNGSRSLDRHIASPLDYLPMSSLRSW